MITIIVIENVLAHGDDLKMAQPRKQAKALYDGFRSQNNTVGLTRAPYEVAKWWLKREHLDDWASIQVFPHGALTWDHWRIEMVTSMLAEGWEIFAYIDTHLHVLDVVKDLGVTAISVAYPHTAPGWKDVAAPRAWAQVASTVDATP